MTPRHVSFLVATILPVFAACALEAPESQTTVITRTSALKQRTDRPAEQDPSPDTPVAVEDGPQIVDVATGCECIKTYWNWRTESATSCDPTECSTQKQFDDCEEGISTDCNHLRSCTCDCTDPSVLEFRHNPADGVYLAGVPELWQFNYGCDAGGANAVGCGPVAMASLLYWWAQRGYPRLVEDHLTAAGQQNWRSFVQELHDDYLDGACIPAWLGNGVSQYLVPQVEMEKELKDYVEDHDAFPHVRHYRVCNGCDLPDDNDRSKSGGLEVIQDELEAGRPLILGYAAGRAEQTSVFVDGETIFTGELSNDAGWINHYAVITGYRRTSDGRDTIYINKGSQPRGPDMALEWNPAGEWTHLFTLSISSDPSPVQFCSLDQPISTMFSSYVDVETSHATRNIASSTREFTVMAGRGCGKAREGVYRPVTVHTADYCPTRALTNFTDDVAAAGPFDEGNQPLDQLGPR